MLTGLLIHSELARVILIVLSFAFVLDRIYLLKALIVDYYCLKQLGMNFSDVLRKVSDYNPTGSAYGRIVDVDKISGEPNSDQDNDEVK